VGAAYSFLYRVNSHFTYQDKNSLSKETKRYTTAVSSQFITGLFSFGVEYNLNRTTFRVEPNISYHVFDVTNSSFNYLNLGLGASVYYRLE
jgi:Trk-type K+ transport system membrane component